MAIGLTDHGWSYRESIWVPVHTDPMLTKQRDERMAQLLTPALQDQPRGRPQTLSPVEAAEGHEGKEAAPLLKAT